MGNPVVGFWVFRVGFGVEYNVSLGVQGRVVGLRLKALGSLPCLWEVRSDWQWHFQGIIELAR